MKKILFIAVVIFAVTGCATRRFNYDRSVPKDSICTLSIPDDVIVVKFDDKRVRWRSSVFINPFVPKEKRTVAKIPAGEHTLVVNFFQMSNYGSYTQIRRADGIEICYEFRPGNAYALTSMIWGKEVMLFIKKL